MVDIRHFHLYCGLGGGARGFNRGTARVGSMEARFRCIGGVDSDPAGIRDAAAAIASVMGHTLLLAWSGQTFALSSTPIWVKPMAVALSVHNSPSDRAMGCAVSAQF